MNSDAITAISAIIIASLAVYGIREWKRQIKGKTNYEIARRYLKASLNLRNTILYVRNPFIFPNETEAALKEHGFEKEEIDNHKINLAVYSRRWKKVQEAWSDLEAELLDAEVSWGSDPVNFSAPLIALTRELFVALQMYLDGNRQKIQDELIYNHGSTDKPDEFSKKVTEAIDKIKEFLKPHLL